jgi:hypothetical protein
MERRLIAEELGVFYRASANGPNGGGGSSSPAPAASLTSKEVSDA